MENLLPDSNKAFPISITKDFADIYEKYWRLYGARVTFKNK